MRAARLSGNAVRIGIALALLGRGALAQPEPDTAAEDHVRRGLELRRNGDDTAALAEFELSATLHPTPRVRAQIGLAMQALGRWQEAEQIQIQVLSNDSDSWVREHRDLLRESLATVQRHLAWLSVECNVRGAELLVNGAHVGELPLSDPARIIVGEVVLEVRARGYDPIRRRIDVPPGTRARESVLLVATAPAPAPWPPVRESALDTGAARRSVGWTSLAGGGILLAGGAVAGIVSAMYSAQYNDDKRCWVGPLTRDQQCGEQRGIAESAEAAAIVALGLGGLGVGVGVFLLTTRTARHDPTSSATLQVACSLGPQFVGCAGRF